MKLLSLFSGIGAFEKALDRLSISYELVGFSEIDKYAIQSYCAIHGVSEEKNLGDITKIDGQALPKDIDLITYGFPCQDISLAGKQKGLFNEDGSQTRSGLFFEALRIIEDTQPKVAIAENVKNLTGKTFKAQFEIVLQSLEEAGYNNYWKVLNAKDFGVPQNRERVFIVSIRKDIDTGRFDFPEGFPLEVRLKDVLDDKVDERYYLSDEQISSIVAWKAQQKPFERVLGKCSISHTLTARGAGENHSGMILYDENLEDTSNLQEKCLRIKEATKKGYAEAAEGDAIKLAQPNSKTRRGRVGHGYAQTITTSPQQAVVEKLVYDGFNQRVRKDQSCVGTLTRNCGADLKRNGQGIIECKVDVVGNTVTAIVEPLAYDEQNGYIRKDGTVGTLTTDGSSPKHNNRVIEESLRIRKITPREAFRLMDFSDEDFDACKNIGMSNAQLYKQAGNSIVVAVPFYIINSLTEAGVFEEASHDESIEDVVEEKISEYCDKEQSEYIFNEKKFIAFLLREGIIEIKQG